MYDIARENSYSTPLQNSPLLPLMLMTLATQKNAPTQIQTPSTIYDEYDFIVVGAGSAGSIVAARLSEVSCVNILLLEAGSTPPLLNDVPMYGANFRGTDLDWGYETTPQEHAGRLNINKQVKWPSGKGLGGSSLLNGMLYVRGNHKNYNDWAAQGATGWSYYEVLPYFKKAENNREFAFAEAGFHGKGGPITVESSPYNPILKRSVMKAANYFGYRIGDINGGIQTGFYTLQASTRNHQRCSTAKAYLVPAENRTNLHILPNAFVNKVIIENNVAVGVSFDINGTMHEVKARREVIMSAGTTNTAQLLMLSGIGPKEELQKHKIPLVVDLPVGENFQDHCTSISSFEVDSNIPLVTEKISSKRNTKRYIKRRTGILTSFGASVMAFLRGRNIRHVVDDPTYQLYFGENVAQLFKTLVVPEAYLKVYQPYENKPLYLCGSQILQPKSRGYVRLQSTDPHDPPVINPNYFADPQDVQDVVEGMKTCYMLAKSPPMLKMGSKPLNFSYPGCEQYTVDKSGDFPDEYYACQAKSMIITQSHQVGTAKMGNPYDPTTVVDPELRVKGIRGLRVVDASVMPIVPSGNTNIPTIMVAEKASDIIKGSIKCENTPKFNAEAYAQAYAPETYAQKLF